MQRHAYGHRPAPVPNFIVRRLSLWTRKIVHQRGFSGFFFYCGTRMTMTLSVPSFGGLNPLHASRT